ncbi:light-regulated signal transduction histidine kinase (bacteriophytochrome) [Variovorax boronicumulans]|uniref:ATP-binding protein n=1 Tax=Variovorax boronicumulans TaxID=436515 RepID=UPI002789054A|nr:ATP-binding protein [Variovorax boronicumulans]MDQ0034970.1 light-regulated signal transduction histidine kinase (bacteriophytochrome) [Variovorax boronicumulans]
MPQPHATTPTPHALRPPEVDLSSCDLEPIRVPGSIQPHGRMLVLEPESLDLVAWSDNWPDGQLDAAQQVLRGLVLPALEPGATPVSLGALRVAGETLDVAAHRSDRHLFAEFEAALPAAGNEAPIYSLGRVFLPKLQEAGTLEQLTQLTAAEMKRLTGFGRCLIYRFDAAGHGEVLAEEADPGYDSYTGHRFPASDIPQQARALYLVNHFRLIADATYTPVPLRAADPALTAADLDLSQAQLRSVSPIHLEYMRNMGTLASMSVSIVIDGRLWGLISCHDHQPRFLDPGTRLACEHLGQLLSLQIQSKESNVAVAERLELRQLTLQIVSHLADSDATLQRLVAESSLMLRLARATGAAVVLDDEVWSVGDVPARAQVQELASWIAGLGTEVYESSELPAHFAAANEFREVAAGVLAISISQVHRHLILWFRPEIVQTIQWAGDPKKPKAAASGRIHPRISFSSWVEEVRGRSAAWTPAEVGAAVELRQALIGVVLRRAEELAAVATELGRVNKELEAFSYTVSHDLRAPMRHIAGYVDLVAQTEGKQLSERAHRYLGHVKDAAAFAGQMVDALLDFSRMGRAALKQRMVDTESLVEGLVRELARLEPARRIEWQVDSGLPTLYADPLLLQVAVRNLLANAVKYSRTRDPQRIAVRAIRSDLGSGLEVEDNGVGFQMKYVDKLFGVFQRLHQAEEFEGTGIGLANVKRIVERHGGTVWAKGAMGEGATFGFILPNREPGNEHAVGTPPDNGGKHA